MSARTFWQQAGGLSAVGVIIALALGAAFMSIGSDQKPRDVCGGPVAILAAYAVAGMVAIVALNVFRIRNPPEGADAHAH